MNDIRMSISEAYYRRLRQHLLPKVADSEQAAFLLCTYAPADHAFECQDVIPIRSRQFEIHSASHLELGDAARARVIKAAHDRKCSLIEAHSHPFCSAAQFSASDFDGLSEFVPHVWWRLRRRPYGALVFTPKSVDGLAWIDGPDAPVMIAAIRAGNRTIQTTGLSYKGLERNYDGQIRPE